MTTPILVAEAERLSAVYGPIPADVGAVDGTEDDFGDLLSEAAAALGIADDAGDTRMPDDVWQSFQTNAHDLATRGTDMLSWLLALRAVTCEDCGKPIEPHDSGLCDSCEGGRQYDWVSTVLPAGAAALDELLSHDRDLLVFDGEGGLIPQEEYDALVALRDHLAGRDGPTTVAEVMSLATGVADDLAAGPRARKRLANDQLAAARTLREEIDGKSNALVDATASADEASAACRPLYDAVTLLLEGCERDA